MTSNRPALDPERSRKNLRTGLILGALALSFVVAFVLKTWHYA